MLCPICTISVPLSPTLALLWCCVPCLHHSVCDICLTVMLCPIRTVCVPFSPTPALLWRCVSCPDHSVSDICSHCDVVSHMYNICTSQSNTCPTMTLCLMPRPLSVWHLFSLWCCVPYVQYLYLSVQHLPYCDVVSHAQTTQCLTFVLTVMLCPIRTVCVPLSPTPALLWRCVSCLDHSVSDICSHCDVVSHTYSMCTSQSNTCPTMTLCLMPRPLSVWHCSHCDVVSHTYSMCTTQFNTCPTMTFCLMPRPLSVWHLFSLWCCVPYVQYLYLSVQHLPYCDVVSHAYITQCLTSVSLWCCVPYVQFVYHSVQHLPYCDVMSHTWTTQCLTSFLTVMLCPLCTVCVPLSPTPALLWCCVPCLDHSVSICQPTSRPTRQTANLSTR